MKKLLVTGASGFLGWNILHCFKSEWTIFGTFFKHPINIPGIIPFHVDLTKYK